MAGSSGPSAGSGWSAGPRPGSAGWWAALAAAFAVASLAVYAPCFTAPFLSDDVYYVANNEYVLHPTPANLGEILDPTSDLTLTMANYAPAQLLVHVVQVQLFGAWTPGYHLTNALLHAAASVLLVALLLGAELSPTAAVLGGVFFLLHPANVEVVAWISQVKTALALVLMLAALRLRRRVVAGSALFGLALLAKALAAIALPVALLLEWTRREPGARRFGALLPWALIFAAFLGSQWAAFQHANQSVPPVSEQLAVRLASSASIGAHYLWMALTGLGVSAFHEPAPVRSATDPWPWIAVVAAALLGARTAWALARRREEAAWWLWAAGSYLPVAQVFPFLFPMADRYLYFILPGLIGGTLLAGRAWLERLGGRRRAWVARAALVLAVVACTSFAVRSHARSRIWQSEARLMADSLLHYPDGSSAHYYRARRAAAEGRPEEAVAELRLATRDSKRGMETLLMDPELAPLHGFPGFGALLAELAGQRIDAIRRAGRLTEANRITLAQAFLLRGEWDRAIAILEDAPPGPPAYEAEVEDLRAQARSARAAAQARR